MLLLTLTQVALGQTTGGAVPDLDAQHFRPTIDGDRTLWTDDSLRGPDREIGGRAMFHYADDPLVYLYEDGSTIEVLSSVLQADLMASFAIDRFRIGAVAPVYLFATSDVVTNSAGFGDLALEGKATALDRDDAPLGLAATLRITLPTSSMATPLGNPNVGWEAAAIADQTFGPVLLAANIGVRGAPRTELESGTLDDYLTGRLAAGYALSDDSGLSAELAGQVPVSFEEPVPAEWLAGGYHHVGSGLTLRGGFGSGLTAGVMAPDYRLVLGLAYEPERAVPPDTDGDGWVDKEDPCPEQAEDPDGIADDGCPEPDPTVTVRAIGPDGAVISTAAVTVSNGVDSWDEGPTHDRILAPGSYVASATAPGYERGDARMSVVGDEGAMSVDVTLQPIATGTLQIVVVDPQGAPLAATIAVAGNDVATSDRWTGPLEPGTPLIRVTADGYKPHKGKATITAGEDSAVRVTLEPAMAVLQGDRIDIKDSVYFDTAKATIQAVSFGLLDEIATILGDHPELTKLRVEGHTDSRGNDAYNKDLSQRRATSVMTYLVEKGVAADRLTAVGFGEEKLLDTTNTTEAHDKNRRVDFFVVERSD